ncbi:putative short-chain dehydrogenase [Fusarium solani]|uniref:Short-chain dehydrogenase n=1 Tax=Fusarium solani TaxID=169388 RepID=A0A9P9JUY6_FUSSL|nr:putative short-chain dehydrogenase [Fusarium solani]KAH7237958.1 putative short-chain dehydrogenase [Fusarium solani]
MSVFDFAQDQRAKLPNPDPSLYAGKTYIVTGANAGLGFQCTKHLFAAGAQRIILAIRSLQNGESALATIREETGRHGIGEVWEIDLSSFDSVEKFAERVNTLERLDGMVENAGIALDRFSLAEGRETSLTVNVLSTFLLAVRAMPILQASAQKFGTQTHLTIVSSSTAFMRQGRLDGIEGNVFDALSTQRADMADRYPLSKELQIYAVRQLAALFPVSNTNVIINTVSPGLCNTNLNTNSSWFERCKMSLVMALAGRTPEEGSRTLLHGLAAGPESHGKFLSACEIKEHTVPPWMQDENTVHVRERVWGEMVKSLQDRGHNIEIRK